MKRECTLSEYTLRESTSENTLYKSVFHSTINLFISVLLIEQTNMILE